MLSKETYDKWSSHIDGLLRKFIEILSKSNEFCYNEAETRNKEMSSVYCKIFTTNTMGPYLEKERRNKEETKKVEKAEKPR